MWCVTANCPILAMPADIQPLKTVSIPSTGYGKITETPQLVYPLLLTTQSSLRRRTICGSRPERRPFRNTMRLANTNSGNVESRGRFEQKFFGGARNFPATASVLSSNNPENGREKRLPSGAQLAPAYRRALFPLLGIDSLHVGGSDPGCASKCNRQSRAAT